MLVLSRRLGESLIIGEDITLTVLGITGNQVRLGIAAPEEVSVHREEVFNRIRAEQSQPSEPTQTVEANLTFATGSIDALNFDATDRRFLVPQQHAKRGHHPHGTLGLRRRHSS